MKRYTYSFIVLLMFYVLLSSVFFGYSSSYSTTYIIIPVVILALTGIPTLILKTDYIANLQYDQDHVLYTVVAVQMVLVILFVATVIAFGFIALYSPILGYVMFIISYLVTIAATFRDYRRLWPYLALTVQTLVFVMFIGYESITIDMFIIGFVYMVLHNITIVSYGTLKVLSPYN